MVSKTLLALHGAVFLLLVASQPIRSETTTKATNNTKSVCPVCPTKECKGDKSNCPVKCIKQCIDGYYQVKKWSPGDCSPLGGTVIVDESIDINEGKSRRRRQDPSPPTTQTPAPTTTEVPQVLCKKCSLLGCNMCINGVTDQLCENCTDGYFLNNATSTCERYPDEDEFPAWAVAGIVIGGICLVGIVGVGILLFVRRSRRWHGFNSHFGTFQKTGKGAQNCHLRPKFSAEEIVTKRDEMKEGQDPSRKISPVPKDYTLRPSRESSELRDIGMAPPPPDAAFNPYIPMQESYGKLDTKSPDDPSFYTPLNTPQDNIYQNQATSEEESGDVYENTKDVSCAWTNSHKPSENISSSGAYLTNQPSVTSGSGELYEPVGVRPAVEIPSEVYDDCQVLVHNNEVNAEDLYMNEDISDIYQNT